MGKDRQGKWRGRCAFSGCVCALYTKEDLKDKLRCDYCEHAPGVHALLGKCSGCVDCENYEVDDEEIDGKGECSYCGCEAKNHEVTTVKSTAVSQAGTVPASMCTPAVPPATTSNLPPTIGPTHPPMSTTGPGSQHGGHCKFPGCQKPCYVEGQKVHEFCGRTHASAYFAMRSGGPVNTRPTPPMPYSTPRPAVSEMMRYATPPSMASSNTVQPPGQPPVAAPPSTSPPPHFQTQVGAPPSPTLGSSSRPKCRNPQCQRPCYVEGDKVFDYCGRTCRNSHAS